MLESIPFIIIIGTILGILSGMGVGGGSLLILWLTLVLGMEHSMARTINLLFFIPSAIVSTFFRWRQGTLNKQVVLPAIIGGCISAALFSWIGKHTDVAVLQKLFGILLLFTGLTEITYKPKKRR